jgi:hypothetical protein
METICRNWDLKVNLPFSVGYRIISGRARRGEFKTNVSTNCSPLKTLELQISCDYQIADPCCRHALDAAALLFHLEQWLRHLSPPPACRVLYEPAHPRSLYFLRVPQEGFPATELASHRPGHRVSTQTCIRGNASSNTGLYPKLLNVRNTDTYLQRQNEHNISLGP